MDKEGEDHALLHAPTLRLDDCHPDPTPAQSHHQEPPPLASSQPPEQPQVGHDTPKHLEADQQETEGSGAVKSPSARPDCLVNLKKVSPKEQEELTKTKRQKEKEEATKQAKQAVAKAKREAAAVAKASKKKAKQTKTSTKSRANKRTRKAGRVKAASATPKAEVEEVSATEPMQPANKQPRLSETGDAPAAAKVPEKRTRKPKRATIEAGSSDNQQPQRKSKSSCKPRTSPKKKASKPTAEASDAASTRKHKPRKQLDPEAAKKSRKCSAYHTAKRRALKDGLTKDEALKAAKEVPRCSFNISSFNCF